MRMDYAAMRESRFRRRRPGVLAIGSDGDKHYPNSAQFIKMREYARSMIRDDFFAKMLVNRACDNTIRDGFTYEPQTGDDELNKALADRQNEWSLDATQCDLAGELTFPDIERLMMFTEIVDGDLCIVGTTTGALQTYEAERLSTPSKYGAGKNIVHGIEMDDQRKRKRYYFRKDNVGINRTYERLFDFDPIDAYDEDGYKQVWHIHDPHRFTLTRGITAFHPIFDKAGMLEDIDFALLVKQQMAACLAWEEQTDPNAAQGGDSVLGARHNQRQIDGSNQVIEEVAPGMILRSPPGKKLVMHAPNMPTTETMEHLRFCMMMISVNLGMPLFVALMDPREGSFSTWRGAMDQAKLGFIRNQQRYESRFHRHVIEFNVRRWLGIDDALGKLLRSAIEKGLKIFGHVWHKPRWPYIQPLHDAQADTKRVNNFLAGASQVIAENGDDADRVIADTIGFNKKAIIAAINAAKEIKTQTQVEVAWRDVYNRELPTGAQMIDTEEQANTLAGNSQPQPAKKN
jgi:capsid protein